LADTTEATAINAIFECDLKRELRTWWSDIKRGLDKLGIKRGERAQRVAAWGRIQSPAIVACGKHLTAEGQPNWHWVVFVPDAAGGLVYDPLREGPVRPSRIRRKPFSYLQVTPKQ
jgi:hypothetical protein